MDCPFCNATLPSKRCNSCFRENLTEALYCMYCGAFIGQGGDEEIDLEERILCPDGNCTGIIENGRCTVCGRPCEES